MDDTPANLTLLAGMLREKGRRVQPLPSGRPALKAEESRQPDLILLDIKIPEMDGYEVRAQLKQDIRFKDIPDRWHRPRFSIQVFYCWLIYAVLSFVQLIITAME